MQYFLINWLILCLIGQYDGGPNFKWSEIWPMIVNIMVILSGIDLDVGPLMDSQGLVGRSFYRLKERQKRSDSKIWKEIVKGIIESEYSLLIAIALLEKF